MQLTTIGYACGLAAGDSGCGDGPAILKNSMLLAQALAVQLNWQALLTPVVSEDKYNSIAEINQRLAEQVAIQVKQQQPFLVAGGDHSCAIGTWSGVASVLQAQGTLGLIWIDAHLDSHTPQTSQSGNIHGMPLACLLGQGDQRLTQIAGVMPKLLPQHVCVIGARSYESGEQDLLERLGVRIFYMPECARRGIEDVMQEALSIVRNDTAGYGISLDIDGLDPSDAPGVGTSAPDGIAVEALAQALEQVQKDANLVGLEITEFNPHHDQAGKTEQAIARLINAVYNQDSQHA